MDSHRRLLRCTRSKVWLPDEYLTSIVGNCDRGHFFITREFTLSCTGTHDGGLYIEGFDQLEVSPEEIILSQLRCATCGSECEFIDVDAEEMLQLIRAREVDMKRKVGERLRQPGSKPRGGSSPDAPVAGAEPDDAPAASAKPDDAPP